MDELIDINALGHDPNTMPNLEHLWERMHNPQELSIVEIFRSVEGSVVDTSSQASTYKQALIENVHKLETAFTKIAPIYEANKVLHGKYLTELKTLTPQGEWIPLLESMGVDRFRAHRHMKAYAETLLLPAPDKPKKVKPPITGVKAITWFEELPPDILKELVKYVHKNYPQVSAQAQAQAQVQVQQPSNGKQTVTIDSNNIHYFK